MNNKHQPIELYENVDGTHSLRVGPRVAHLGKLVHHRAIKQDEQTHWIFAILVRDIREGDWDLDQWQHDGNQAESFEDYKRRTFYNDLSWEKHELERPKKVLQDIPPAVYRFEVFVRDESKGIYEAHDRATAVDRML